MKTHYELVVVGGGLTGACASIAAARQGVDTLLIERWNCLGGAAAGNLVSPFMRYWTTMPDTKERKILCNGIFTEILQNTENMGCSPEKHHPCEFDEEILKLVLNRMVIDAGVQLLFNTVQIFDKQSFNVSRVKPQSK